MRTIDPVSFAKGAVVNPPYFKVTNPDESFQLVCRNLEPGDIPLCLEYKGAVHIIQSISCSAYNVSKLLNSLDVSIVTVAGQFPIKDINDYMEGVPIWI